jgi:chromate transporter
MTSDTANVAAAEDAPPSPRAGSPLEVLLVFFKLGVSCFGGPIAHIGYFREEFVVRRRWLDEQAYVDLWRCASSCRDRPRARSDFRLG